jgi:hypothetical protein
MAPRHAGVTGIGVLCLDDPKPRIAPLDQELVGLGQLDEASSCRLRFPSLIVNLPGSVLGS